MKGVLLLISFVCVIVCSQAQYSGRNSGKRDRSSTDGSSFMDKMYFSGGGGFGTGSGYYGKYTYYSLLPTVGYRVTNELLLGFNFTYSSYNYSDIGINFTQTGYAPFVRYYIQQQYFAQVEYATISSLSADTRVARQYYDRFLIGAGFVQPVGKRGGLNVMALYDVLYNDSKRGIFGSPFVFRVFFSF